MMIYILKLTDLGLLSAINFITQVITDLAFDKAVDKHVFRIFSVVTLFLAFVGFTLCNAAPGLFSKQSFIGFVLGTLVFSCFGGFQKQLSIDFQKKYVINEGDILFGRAGSIERHTYVEKEYAGTFQGTNCIRICCNDKTISKYVSYFLWLKNVKSSIENNTGGSVQAYISSDLLKDISVVLPDKDTIKKITVILDKLDKKIKINNAINDNLAA